MKPESVKRIRDLMAAAGATLAAADRAAIEADIRAEEFWSRTAPHHNEELLALRPIEVYARTIAKGGKLSKAQLAELGKALDGLDATRKAIEKARAAAAS